MISEVFRSQREDALFNAATGEPIPAAVALALVRRRAKLTQVELARRSGVAQTHISAVEGGREPLTLARAKKLAEALGVHPRVLLFPEGDGEACATCGRKR